MILLALEFSSPARSVALVELTSNGTEPRVLAEVSDEAKRSTRPIMLIQSALDRADVQPQEVNAIMVSLGPGSYTGVRSSVALAQGWQLARDVPVYGQSVVDVLVLQLRKSKFSGRCSVVIDAQRGECYFAAFDVDADRCELVEPLRLMKVEELRSRAESKAGIFVGPEIGRWLPEGRTILPSAAALAQLPVRPDASGAGEALEPIYLREISFVKAPPPREFLS